MKSLAETFKRDIGYYNLEDITVVNGKTIRYDFNGLSGHLRIYPEIRECPIIPKEDIGQLEAGLGMKLIPSDVFLSRLQFEEPLTIGDYI